MSPSKLYISQCSCEICRLGVEHPEQIWHYHINLLMSRLDEQQRRWLAGLLAEHYGVGKGGIKLVSQVTGLSDKTIQRGIQELSRDLIERDPTRIRLNGAGRPPQMN